MLFQLTLILSSSALVVLIFVFAEIATGKLKKRSRDDLFLDLATFALPDLIAHPLVVFVVAALMSVLLPRAAGALAGTPWWVQILAFLVFEDMVNYWFHRSAHRNLNLMWSYHLAHHTPEYMSSATVRRNSFFYILAFPNQYTAAILVYLGFGDVFVVYSAIKNVVVTAAHSELRWDAFLYRYKFLHPLAWLIERTISTPATHFAHHAEHNGDGIGHHDGNFGNLLFFWDVLFGTALISRKYPTSFGIGRDEAIAPWHVQLFHPLFRSPRPDRVETAAPSQLDLRPRDPVAS